MTSCKNRRKTKKLLRKIEYSSVKVFRFPIEDLRNDKRRSIIPECIYQLLAVIPECIYQESTLFKDEGL